MGGKEGDECAHQCALNGGSRRRCVCRHCLQIVGTARTAEDGGGRESDRERGGEGLWPGAMATRLL